MGAERKGWFWAAVLTAAVGITIGAVWFVLFRVNVFSLEVRLAGEPSVILEYGEDYREPGAEAWLHGTKFWQDGKKLEDVRWTTESDLNDQVLGQYALSYRANFFIWQGQARRTVQVADTRKPEIILKEDGPLEPGQPYLEAGYSAVDNYDGDLTLKVKRVVEPGQVIYTVADSSGNTACVRRAIPFYDNLPPEIYLTGGGHITIPTGTYFVDPGFEAVDNVDGDLNGLVRVEGEVRWYESGVYPVTYRVTDAQGNERTVVRQVEVKPKPRPALEEPERKTVYLTFDDGPGPYTRQLLKVLDAYGAKATFFVTDSGYEDVLKEIVDRDHGIGIHTRTHDYASIYASPEAYFEDLYGMQDVIFNATGVKTTLMRFPGGSSNLVSRHSCEGIMTTLVKSVEDAGFQYFDWNVDSDDAGQAKKASVVLANVKEGVAAEAVSIVLQHDIHGYSVETVEDILIWGTANGYVFKALTPNTPPFHHNVQN